MADLAARLAKAIADEREAHAEYKALAEQTSGEDRDTLLAMAADEHRHEQNLERISGKRRR